MCRCVTLCFNVGTQEEAAKHSVSFLSSKTSVHGVFLMDCASAAPPLFSASGDVNNKLQLSFLIIKNIAYDLKYP